MYGKKSGNYVKNSNGNILTALPEEEDIKIIAYSIKCFM
ncbi:MAG: hypothetical protein RHS_5007 [Robinsoniella sp. RHS]|nr:MAG: hypothetical protein RHS_5007 [Robinsoniella sp. RHS]